MAVRRAPRLLRLVALLALLAGGSLALYWNEGDPLRLPWGEAEDGRPLRAAAQGERDLVLRHEWPDGTVGRIARQPLPPELAGRPPGEVAALHPHGRLVSFNDKELVVAVPCQRDQEGFVGVAAGRVAIYDGTPDGCSRLRETTDMSLGELPSFHVVDLRRGIPFADEEELRLILEGLRSP